MPNRLRLFRQLVSASSETESSLFMRPMIAAGRSLAETAHPAALAYSRRLLRFPLRLTLKAVPSRNQSLKAKGEDGNGSDTVWRTKRKCERRAPGHLKS